MRISNFTDAKHGSLIHTVQGYDAYIPADLPPSLDPSCSLSPAEIWSALDISRQGAMDLINPLLTAGMIERTGGKKTGRYTLRKP